MLEMFLTKKGLYFEALCVERFKLHFNIVE